MAHLPHLTSVIAGLPTPTLYPPSPVTVLRTPKVKGTHRGARKTREASFSSLTGQADHTTLSSNALRSRSSGSTLYKADGGEVPHRGWGPGAYPGPLRSSHLQQVHQHQEILSRQ